MSFRRMLRLLALAAGVVLLLLPGAACASEHRSFLELSTGDFTNFCPWDESCFSPAGRVYYNRVDGLLTYFGFQYRTDTRLHPRLRAMLGWPSAHGASYYQIEIEQPVHSQDSFSFGVNLYDKSSWSMEDDENITDFGNNMHALWAREDERDYWRAEGVTVFAQHKATPSLTFRVEYRSDRLESMTAKESVWTVFNRDDEWRENPSLMVGVLDGAREFEGRMNSYVWSVRYDSVNDSRTNGWLGKGVFEFGGKTAGGDYEFRKHLIDVTRLLPITETQTLTLRGVWGLASGTDYPSHKLFHLGGRGDLRGYDYKEFSGKDLIFGRVEYTVQMNDSIDMIYFLESGKVSYGSTTEDSDDSDGHLHDAGIGVYAEAPWGGWVRLDVAKAIADDSDVKVHVGLFVDLQEE